MSLGRTTPDAALPDAADVSALVLGAGMGLRLGLGPKAFLRPASKETLLERAVQAVAPFACEVIVGVPPDDVARAHALLDHLPWRATIVTGGATRQETVERVLARATRPLVLLHEVARPMVSPELFEQVLSAAADTGAAALYLPLETRDAVAMTDAGAPDMLGAPLARSRVVTLQCPHAYRREVLLDAHRQAAEAGWREDGTAVLVRRAGHAVRLVRGAAENVKLTYPSDLPPAPGSPLPAAERTG